MCAIFGALYMLLVVGEGAETVFFFVNFKQNMIVRGVRGVPTRAAAADRERSTSAAARLVRCANSRTVLWMYWGCVSSSSVSVWISCYIAAVDLVVYMIFIVYLHVLNTKVYVKNIIVH